MQSEIDFILENCHLDNTEFATKYNDYLVLQKQNQEILDNELSKEQGEEFGDE